MLDFKETQFNNLKDFISNEEWERLPLPENYEVKEFKELLTDYPENFKKRIRIFQNHFGGRVLDHSSDNIFARFCDGNPFDFDDLVANDGKMTPIPIKRMSRKTKSFKNTKNLPNATKAMAKRNPFSIKNNFLDEETKEENLGEGIDDGVTLYKGMEKEENNPHTDIFYQQMDAVSQNIVISSSGLNLVKALFRYVELINVLNPFSFEILIGLTQMFEFYVFAAFFLYASEEGMKLLFEDSFHSKISGFSQETSGSKNFQAKLNQLQSMNAFQKKFSTLRNELMRIED